MFGWFQLGDECSQQGEKSAGFRALSAGRCEIQWDRSPKLRTVDERDQAVWRKFAEALQCQSKVGIEKTRRRRKRSGEGRGVELCAHRAIEVERASEHVLTLDATQRILRSG